MLLNTLKNHTFFVFVLKPSGSQTARSTIRNFFIDFSPLHSYLLLDSPYSRGSCKNKQKQVKSEKQVKNVQKSEDRLEVFTKSERLHQFQKSDLWIRHTALATLHLSPEFVGFLKNSIWSPFCTATSLYWLVPPAGASSTSQTSPLKRKWPWAAVYKYLKTFGRQSVSFS